MPKIPGEGKEGCTYCATEGGVMHSMPHTAGLTRKPHYCKLPHFTLSKGAKRKRKEKKTPLTSGKTFLMVRLRSQHALTTHYISYMFYEMLLPIHGSLKPVLLLSHFGSGLQGSISLWGPSRLVLLVC